MTTITPPSIPDDITILDAFQRTLDARYGDWLTATRSDGGLDLKHHRLALASHATIGFSVSKNTILVFTDINRTLDVESQSFADAFGGCEKYSFSDMTEAYAYARDHLDSIAFLPGELRERRVQEAADSFGISVQMLIRLGKRVDNR